MEKNLLESLSGYITPDLISNVAGSLGESQEGVSKAMSSAMPALLGGLLSKADNPNVMDSIMGLVNNKSFDADNVLSNLGSLVSDKGSAGTLDMGSNFLGMLFGDKQSGVFDTLASSAGLKKSSITKIMGMAAPLVLGYLKKSGFNASSLIKMLTSQKSVIGSMMPKGLDSLMGFGDNAAGDIKAKLDNISQDVQSKPKNKWLWPVILIVGLLLLFALYRNCNGENVETTTVKKIDSQEVQTVFGKATNEELAGSYELGATPDPETIAKFQEKANKTFSLHRAYCYDEESWLNRSWESNITSPATAAKSHKELTGHNTGVRWQ